MDFHWIKVWYTYCSYHETSAKYFVNWLLLWKKNVGVPPLSLNIIQCLIKWVNSSRPCIPPMLKDSYLASFILDNSTMGSGNFSSMAWWFLFTPCWNSFLIQINLLIYYCCLHLIHIQIIVNSMVASEITWSYIGFSGVFQSLSCYLYCYDLPFLFLCFRMLIKIFLFCIWVRFGGYPLRFYCSVLLVYFWWFPLVSVDCDSLFLVILIISNSLDKIGHCLVIFALFYKSSSSSML